jgi:hypothetical protein
MFSKESGRLFWLGVNRQTNVEQVRSMKWPAGQHLGNSVRIRGLVLDEIP